MAYAGFLRTLPAPASTLSGFVCLLDTTWFTQADANALDGTTFINGGGSLRLYTDATKTTQLPVDVISFVTGGTPEVKVFTRLPSYASGSTIWVESDEAATTQPVSTSTYGSEAVWLDYDMFTLDGVTDRSGNKTLTPTSMATASSDSPVGGSVADFDGTSSWFSHTQTGTSTDTTPFTIKAWIKPVSATNQAGIAIAEAFNRNYGYGLRTDGKIRGELFYSGSSRNVDSTNTRTANAWNYTAYTYESDTQHNVYLNGVYSTDTYGGRHFRRDVDLRWGKQATYSSSGIRGWFDGEMSAMGVLKSNNGLLKDDFDSEYANQNSPSTFGSSSGWTTGGGGATIIPTGIATGEAFGTALVQNTLQELSPTGIATEEAFGTAIVSTGGFLLSPVGKPTSEAFGSPSVEILLQTLQPTSISSLEAFGTAIVEKLLQLVEVAGIGTQETFGSALVLGGDSITIPVDSRQTWNRVAAYLRTLNFKGSDNDVICGWLRSEGIDDQYNDMWVLYFNQQGLLGGTLTDKQKRWERGE